MPVYMFLLFFVLLPILHMQRAWYHTKIKCFPRPIPTPHEFTIFIIYRGLTATTIHKRSTAGHAPSQLSG